MYTSIVDIYLFAISQGQISYQVCVCKKKNYKILRLLVQREGTTAKRNIKP